MNATDFNRLLTDDRGVSPVIAAILMIAVVVVIGAGLGVFAYGFDERLSDPAPEPRFDFSYNTTTGVADIDHDGGETIRAKNTGLLKITADGNTDPTAGTWGSNLDPAAGDGTATAEPTSDISVSDDVWESQGDTNVGDEITVHWFSNNREQSAALGTFTANDNPS